MMTRLILVVLLCCLLVSTALAGGKRRGKRSGEGENEEVEEWTETILENCPALFPGAEEEEDHDEERNGTERRRRREMSRRRKRDEGEEGEEGEEDEDHDKPSKSNKETSHVIRGITILLIFIFSMLFGLLPLKTLSMKYRSRIASIANCFGGGVFFGTCFMHLIPEVKMQITEYFEILEIREIAGAIEANPGSCDPGIIPSWIKPLKKLPIPEMLECSGFLLILSIEKIAESAKKIRPLTQRFSVFISTNKLKAAQKLVKKQQELEAINDGCEDHGEIEDCPEHCDTRQQHQDGRRVSEQSIKSAKSAKSTTSSGGSRAARIPAQFIQAMKGSLYNRVPNPKNDEPCVPGQQKKSAAMLIMALSIHSFFEGLAIGVESTQAVFIQLAAAITVHKCVIAFAVGSRLIHCGKTILDMVLCLVCMCGMTPIGVILAMGIIELLDPNNLLIVSGSIQGISTGFFLYITFAEMLFQEMKSKHDSALKVSFMTFGVLLVTASTIWHNWNGAHAH